MKVDFTKYQDGLAPAIIQDHETQKVLMLGFMNQEALDMTEKEGKVTFFSRSKGRLWTKGEESGNFLLLKSLAVDCDQDALLIKAEPLGPVCHTGADTCWDEKNHKEDFLATLEDIIQLRRLQAEGKGGAQDGGGDVKESYVAGLFKKGINKIAQKVGEEAIELVIEAKDHDEKLFLNEAADLLFHYLILLNAKGYSLQDVTTILQERHKK
jgi:phosphoribosyl-ATP pyrophosphohydrolase/phosphoribosyl-AMP cyclohydrolase